MSSFLLTPFYAAPRDWPRWTGKTWSHRFFGLLFFWMSNVVKMANVDLFGFYEVIPDFPVACRRLTPGPGYLEALCEDNVSYTIPLLEYVDLIMMLPFLAWLRSSSSRLI